MVFKNHQLYHFNNNNLHSTLYPYLMNEYRAYNEYANVYDIVFIPTIILL